MHVFSCRAQTRDDQTAAQVLNKQQQTAKKMCAVMHFGPWYFYLGRIRHHMCAFYDVNQPNLLSSPVQSPPLCNAKCSPYVLSSIVGQSLCSRPLCRAVSSQGPRANGRSPVKEAVSEEGVSLSLSFSDMSLVYVEGLVFEAPPQPLPWPASRYCL